jgi:hypothetical protein
MTYETTKERRGARGILSCLVSLVSCLLWSPAAPAQTGDTQVYYTRQPEIRVPFGRDTTNRLKQVQLYVYTDQGRDWHLANTAPPDAGYFPPFNAVADGTYWFAVRSLDFQDRPNPVCPDEIAPAFLRRIRSGIDLRETKKTERSR